MRRVGEGRRGFYEVSEVNFLYRLLNLAKSGPSNA